MNVFCLVGKIEKLPELKQTSSGIKVATLTLKVDRPFTNSEGVYEQDEIQIELWRGLAETVCEVSHQDDVVSVKGRVAAHPYQKEDKTYYHYAFVAEKLDFIHA